MKLEERIAAFECVSFDVFDTAIARTVAAPEDVFDRVGARAGVPEFRTARLAAQRAAETAHAHAATLDDIYAALAGGAALADAAGVGGTAHALAGADGGALRALELDVEREVSVVVPEIAAAFAHARALGKQLVFASDMYLPPAFIDELLRRAGYAGYDRLYVSSALGGVTKWSGALFSHMARELALAPERILHVGDDARSDFYGALKAGVTPFHYRRASAKTPAR
jgi:predicted HAD superfamily hydrolase